MVGLYNSHGGNFPKSPCLVTEHLHLFLPKKKKKKSKKQFKRNLIEKHVKECD